MIDVKQLDLLQELADKYNEYYEKKINIKIKIGSHPASSEFAFSIGDSCIEYNFTCIDDLIESIEDLLKEQNQQIPFEIGDTVWFFDIDRDICCLTIDDIAHNQTTDIYIYYEKGHYVIGDKPIFKTKNELIDNEIKKLEAQKD